MLALFRRRTSLHSGQNSSDADRGCTGGSRAFRFEWENTGGAFPAF
jgi:hypothetical protein